MTLLQNYSSLLVEGKMISWNTSLLLLTLKEEEVGAWSNITLSLYMHNSCLNFLFRFKTSTMCRLIIILVRHGNSLIINVEDATKIDLRIKYVCTQERESDHAINCQIFIFRCFLIQFPWKDSLKLIISFFQKQEFTYKDLHMI